jgi:methyl-accepting chemotaxis protein
MANPAMAMSGVPTAAPPGGALSRWFRDLRVGVKLGACTVVALGAVLTVGWVGVHALGQVATRTAEMQKLNGYTRTTLEADMAHDAIRADVLRGMLDPGGTQVDAARADFVDHSAILRDGVESFRAAGMPADVRAAADHVTPAVQNYLALADQTLGAAAAGQARPPTFPRFLEAFSAVEDQLPAVSDALEAHVAIATREVTAKRRSAVITLVVTALGCGLLLVLLSWLVARSILSPLRRVSAVLARLAQCDLTGSVGLDSRDEFGAMAGGLDGAIGVLRSTMRHVGDTAGRLTGAAGQVSDGSAAVSGTLAAATAKASTATTAADQVNGAVQSVRAGAEEMSASINEIAGSAGRAAQVAEESRQVTRTAGDQISALAQASADIGGVVKLITSIADQTNLLALNATIEAARAGEAGKGFAVVAGEVKDLAQETAKATQDISARVQAIQDGSRAAADAIGQIHGVIDQITQYSTTIASAVEEQSATTGEMSRALGDAATASHEVSRIVGDVSQVTEQSADGARHSQQASSELATLAAELNAAVATFSY